MTSRPPLPRRTPQSAALNSGPAKVKEALDARDALATALTRAGIQLPAMDVRTPWADTVPEERSGEIRYALVHLGVCSAPVAHALATAITNGLAG
ncbi:hypothetical protein ACTFBT_30785 [Streptomyces microflavus]|uniref:Uncharacterized protein n=1 Tax=Streptomyces microflavus TaxID=1919 RepID=A0A7J0D1H3_STRMI|nr:MULTISPECIES: hypothetical protein [Streptomyces]MDX2979222.1 hypothetical protein [Streptomyces sp. NRRL_B-2249]GFN07867.1 hypothetical protein Smic_64230 [Streptomyces microflavus]GGX68983.1 hypothetical protein GCM10010298_36850 [Streptomyces microflavus]